MSSFSKASRGLKSHTLEHTLSLFLVFSAGFPCRANGEFVWESWSPASVMCEMSGNSSERRGSGTAASSRYRSGPRAVSRSDRTGVGPRGKPESGTSTISRPSQSFNFLSPPAPLVSSVFRRQSFHTSSPKPYGHASALGHWVIGKRLCEQLRSELDSTVRLELGEGDLCTMATW